MCLTEARILECKDGDELFELLSAELTSRLPDEEGDDLDVFVTQLHSLPPGLRAMAASYQLDVSMTLDDLGCHFANWHHRPYCDETLRSLRELEATEEAEIFEAAYAFAEPYWDRIGELLEHHFDEFAEWYRDSKLEKTLDPLNRRLWDLWEVEDDGLRGILKYWPRYARKYPHRVTQMAS